MSINRGSFLSLIKFILIIWKKILTDSEMVENIAVISLGWYSYFNKLVLCCYSSSAFYSHKNLTYLKENVKGFVPFPMATKCIHSSRNSNGIIMTTNSNYHSVGRDLCLLADQRNWLTNKNHSWKFKFRFNALHKMIGWKHRNRIAFYTISFHDENL